MVATEKVVEVVVAEGGGGTVFSNNVQPPVLSIPQRATRAQGARQAKLRSSRGP